MFKLLPLLIYTVLHLRKNIGFLMGLKEVGLWLQCVAKPLIYAIVSPKRLLAMFMLNHFVYIYISYLRNFILCCFNCTNLENFSCHFKCICLEVFLTIQIFPLWWYTWRRFKYFLAVFYNAGNKTLDMKLHNLMCLTTLTKGIREKIYGSFPVYICTVC